MPDDALPPLREVIATHNLRAERKFGQNFILDLNLTQRIARAGGDLSECSVIEIGPGPGGLTRGLLMSGARKVIVIEADERFLPALEDIKTAYPDRLEIVQGDALQISPDSLTAEPYRIISNLPYNIATPLFTGWLENSWRDGAWTPRFLSLTCMFQKEVAQRIVAAPGTANFGRLSVLTGWLTQARILFDVDRQVFVPSPNVTSSIVHVEPRAQPLAPADPQVLSKVTAAAFGQRRKMLRASLKNICPSPSEILAAADIAETKRAEQLEIEEFCTLARLIDDQNRQKPAH
jgi:16S rRNA (adenine1518-N6/adenine1519-N6)-dimethyltransferase